MIDVDRRTAILSSAMALGLPVNQDSSGKNIQISTSNHLPMQVGLYKDLNALTVPSNVRYIRTSGFWHEGEGEQTLVRLPVRPRWLLWPRHVQTRDGAVWRAVDPVATPATFGEVADGSYHPLSERFSTLEAARNTYPFATSLRQSIDWAAVQVLAMYSVGGVGRIPSGIRIITDPIRIPARANLIGESCDPSALCFRAHASSGAFLGGRAVFESKDYTNYLNPDYWHWGSLRSLAVDASGIADHGIALWCMGEHSLLEDVWVQQAKISNILVGGYGAVGTLRNCSVWDAGRYGVWLTRHPSENFPSRGPGVVAGAGSGGSYRISGLSGDHNPIHIRADGTQIVELTGLKSEMSPVVISIVGKGIGPGRQRWTISGFRAEGGEHGDTFLRIEGSAKPSVEISSGATYNYKTLLDDRTVAPAWELSAGSAGITSLVYGRDPLEATIIATQRLGFFGADPCAKGTLPPALGPQATQAEKDELLNRIRALLVGYGLA